MLFFYVYCQILYCRLLLPCYFLLGASPPTMSMRLCRIVGRAPTCRPRQRFPGSSCRPPPSPLPHSRPCSPPSSPPSTFFLTASSSPPSLPSSPSSSSYDSSFATTMFFIWFILLASPMSAFTSDLYNFLITPPPRECDGAAPSAGPCPACPKSSSISSAAWRDRPPLDSPC